MSLFPKIDKLFDQFDHLRQTVSDLQTKLVRLEKLYTTAEDLLQRYATLRRELDALIQDVKTLKAESEKLRTK